MAVGGTPEFTVDRRMSSPLIKLSDAPLPMLNLSGEMESMISSPVAIPSSKDECQYSDASPELPSKGEDARDGGSRFTRAQSSYNLGPRQYSVPVVVNLDNSITKEPLNRTVSESHLTIMKALNHSQNRENELTGDFQLALSLPVISGRHPDIKSISPDTMSELLRGKFDDVIESYQILDCRYPYEFAGGHIIGAESWHTPQFVVDHIESGLHREPPAESRTKRNILIFHCEFSAERGPRAQRLLRERDRIANKDRYPALHYPEIYLLEGGYKAFFEKFPDFCIPKKYTKMIDSEYAENLKMCRSRSKTWASENKQSKNRTGKKYGSRCIRE